MRRLVLAAAFAALFPTAALADGERLYAKHCVVCHKADGRGDFGVYPPLAGRLGAFVATSEGRAYLARVLAYGLYGPIKVDKRPYNGLMPPLPQLADGDIAALLNHVLTTLGGDDLPAGFAPFTADEVAGHRGVEASFSDMRREREALLLALRARAEGVESIPLYAGTTEDYARNCQGCHRADGMGAVGAVPRLRRFVGYFTYLPEGRAYIATPPAHMLPHLDDARLAALLNWILETYSPDEVVAGFAPYTAAEVGRLRKEPINAVLEMRGRLLAELQAAGVVPRGDDGINSAAH